MRLMNLSEQLNIKIMDTSNLMIFQELNQEEFDFDSLLNNKDYTVLAGLPVKIDRIIRDITQTTVVAISGTMIMKGVKVRGVWDMYGNIVEFKKTLKLFTPNGYDLNMLFSDTTNEMFRLVHVQKIEKKDD